MSPRPERLEGCFRLIRRRGRYPPQSVGNSMHVSIDANGVDAERQVQHQIGSFPSHAGKSQKLLSGSGNLVVSVGQQRRDSLQLFGLRSIEACGKDESGDGFFFQQASRSRVGGCCKQPAAGVEGDLILRSQRQDSSSKNLPRRGTCVAEGVERGGGKVLGVTPELRKNGFPVLTRRRRLPLRVRAGTLLPRRQRRWPVPHPCPAARAFRGRCARLRRHRCREKTRSRR